MTENRSKARNGAAPDTLEQRTHISTDYFQSTQKTERSSGLMTNVGLKGEYKIKKKKAEAMKV